MQQFSKWAEQFAGRDVAPPRQTKITFTNEAGHEVDIWDSLRAAYYAGAAQSEVAAKRVTAKIEGWGEVAYCPHDPRAVASVRRLIDDHLERQAAERHVFVVTQARDGRPALVEVYSDFDVAQARQRELGVGSTTLASRRIDDPLLVKRCRSEAGESPSQPASEAAEHVHVVSVSKADARLLSELDPSLLASMSKAEREAAERADAAVKEAERLKSECAEAQARQAQGWLPDVSTLHDLKRALGLDEGFMTRFMTKRRFTSWRMSEGQQRAAETVRSGACDLAEAIICHVPQGTERDRAIDALEQASMLAVAGIARPPVGPTTKSEA